jgi:serine protease Do
MSDAGFLDVGNTVDHTFQGAAGQEVTISVHSEDFDPYMTVYGPGGRYLLEVDDANNTLNPMATVTLPRSGTYRVVVGGYSLDTDSGRYYVNVDESIPVPAGPVTILYDSNFLDSGRYQQYFLEGGQGQTVNIALESSEFDPYLRVYDSNNRQIAYVDDSEGSLNAIASVTFPQSGRYRILVQGYSNADSGQYSLTISE